MADDHQSCRLNIQWLRSQMSLVSQMPVLFPLSIRKNITMGKHDASFDEIRAAAANVCLMIRTFLALDSVVAQANAAMFIEEFPDQYETYVGDGGSSMSGGQRQRIAMAVCALCYIFDAIGQPHMQRALIKNPRILLLDEVMRSRTCMVSYVIVQCRPHRRLTTILRRSCRFSQRCATH